MFLPFSFQDKDVTPKTGTTQRAKREKKEKKKPTLLPASRGGNQWDVKQKNEEGTFSAKMLKTGTTFVVENKLQLRRTLMRFFNSAEKCSVI